MSLFQNILVAIDASAESQPVLDCAVRIAQMQNAALKVVDVVPEFSWPLRLVMSGSDHVHELLVQEKSKQLKKIASRLRRANVNVKTKALVGRSSVEIIRHVIRHKHDLVMKDAKGLHSRRPGWFGTTAIELVRMCPCPVWLFQKNAHSEPQHIMAAVDTSPGETQELVLNQKIMDIATQLQSMQKCQLDIVHVWSVYGENMVRDYMKSEEFQELEEGLKKEHSQQLRQLADQYGINADSPNVHLLHGEATSELPKFAEEHQIDLIVMGTVARSGISGIFIGNTFEIILNQVRASILAVKPEGWTSPVKKTAPKAPPKPPATSA